jgi:TPP-dependent trihydroxycyclohexane-1,2-dione (THcHDO) dehydratase
LGHITDWSLPDFKQYEELLRLLARSQHSLVIVTGDVHYAGSPAAICSLARTCRTAPPPYVLLDTLTTKPVTKVS